MAWRLSATSAPNRQYMLLSPDPHAPPKTNTTTGRRLCSLTSDLGKYRSNSLSLLPNRMSCHTNENILKIDPEAHNMMEVLNSVTFTDKYNAMFKKANACQINPTSILCAVSELFII